MTRLERELAELGGDIEVALEEIRVPAALVDRNGRSGGSITLVVGSGDRTGEDVTSVIAPAHASSWAPCSRRCSPEGSRLRPGFRSGSPTGASSSER